MAVLTCLFSQVSRPRLWRAEGRTARQVTPRDLVRQLVHQDPLASSEIGHLRRTLEWSQMAGPAGCRRRNGGGPAATRLPALQQAAAPQMCFRSYRWACPRSESNRHWGPF